MQKKKLIIPVVLLLVLAGLAVYYTKNQRKSTVKGENSNFSIRDTATVTKIFLSDKADNSVLLERKKPGYWTVNGKYKARKDAIDHLLHTMKELRVKAPVPKAAFENVVKRLASKSVKVEVYTNDDDDPVKTYFVGGPNQDNTGTYMLMEDSSVPFLMYLPGLYGYLTTRYMAKENDWRSRHVFKYQYGEIASITVEHPRSPGSSFEIEVLDNNKFKLRSLKHSKEVQHFDTAAVMQYVSYFKEINYEGFEETKSEAYKDSIIANAAPLEIYTVTDINGNIRKIATYKKPVSEATDMEGNPIDYDLDRMYGLIDKKEFVVIQYFVFDVINKEIYDFQTGA